MLIARGLAELGHEVDCWTTTETRTSTDWADVPGLTLHIVDSPFRWGRWYTNPRARPVTTNLVLLGSKAWATPALVRRLLAAHRERPYDVVYRFSTLELMSFGRHLRQLPPLVVHPEVHAAGELRWVRNEDHLARRCHSTTAAGARPVDADREDVAPAPRHPSRGRGHRAEPALRGAARGRLRHRRTSHHASYRTRSTSTASIRRRGGAELERPRRVRITYVGRAAVRKGIDALVELSHRLDDRADEVEIEIIANASLWSDYRPLLDDVNPRVAKVLGFRFSQQVAEALAQSDLLLQPSRYEPFALTVAEALACGTPVVSTDEVGAAEGVDPRCLTATPAGDVDALERAVRARIDDVLAGRDADARPGGSIRGGAAVRARPSLRVPR